jgi:predicted ArsR family transcriptional regulator
MYKNSGPRQRVLDWLLEHESATVDELAGECGVVAVTMRSHLAALQKQGLLSAEEERGRVGRPRRRYRLSPGAKALLPQRSDGLAGDLLDSLQALAGARAVDQLLDVAAARYAGQASAAAKQSLETRVAAVADVLRAEGGATRWEEAEDRFLIRDFHCPYGELPNSHPEVCRYHTQVLVRLLGTPVLLERSIAQGAAHCLFSVQRLPVRPPATVRTLSDGRERR